MRQWQVRIKGTFDDVIVVDAETEEEAEELAREEWRYVEFEDLWVASVHQIGGTDDQRAEEVL